MKKIVCLLLCVFVFASTFLVYAGAEGNTDSGDIITDYADYASLDKSAVVSKAESEGFSRFIDNIGAAFDLAGSESHNNLTLIGISEPVFSSSDKLEFSMDFYFYNPMLLPFKYDGVNVSAGAKVSPYINGLRCGFVSENFSANYSATGSTVYNEMFIKVELCGVINSSAIANSIRLDVDSVWFDIYDDTLFLGSYNFDLKDESSLVLSNIDNIIPISSPAYDLSLFLGMSQVELLNAYPVIIGSSFATFDKGSIIFAYEHVQSDSLYVYVYDEEGFDVQNLDYIHYFDISIDGENFVRTNNVDIISGNSTLVKLRINKLSDVFSNPPGNLFSKTYFINAFRYGDAGNCTDSFGKNFNCNIDSTSSGLSIEVYNVRYELTDVGHTYYRLDNSGVGGVDNYQTLSSVYFSIPSEFFNLNDNNQDNDRRVGKMEISYTKYKTTPVVFVTEKYYDKVLFELEHFGLLVGNKREDSWLDSTWYFPYAIGNNIPDQVQKYYDGVDALFTADVVVEIASFDSPCCIIKVAELEDKVYITSEEFEKYLLNSENPFDGAGESLSFVLNEEDLKVLISRSEMTFSDVYAQEGFLSALWHAFGWDKGYDETLNDIPVFRTLHYDELQAIYNRYIYFVNAEVAGPVLGYPENFYEEWEEFETYISEEFLISPSDVGEFCGACGKAALTNNSMIISRFDTYDYYATNFVYDRNGDFVDAVVAKEVYYDVFDILELELLDNYNNPFVIKIDMEPISFVGGDFTRPNVILPDLLPDLPPDWGIRVPELPDFSWVLAVVTGILVILGLFILWPILTSFFRLIFGRRKKDK